MTTTAGHTPDHALPRHTPARLGRSLAAASGVLLLIIGLTGPATATTRPGPGESPSPTPPASPSPSPTPGGNAPPEFLECPGIIVQAGVPESIGFQVTDPDDDPVTLTNSASSAGGEATIDGHTLTYTAPSTYSGQDFLAVTADDGRDGTDVCDLSIRVEPQPDPTPTPTPTSPSPTGSSAPTPTEQPTTPAPSSPSSTPAPSQAPTSGPAPTTAPSPAPSTPGTTAPTAAPSGGGASDTGAGTPGATSPGGGGSGEGSGGGSGGRDGGAGGGEAPEEDSAPSGGASAPATATQRLRDLTREATVSCSQQAVERARTVIQGLSTEKASRPSGGNVPDGSGRQDDSTPRTPGADSTPVAASDRASAVTGSSIWLFAGVGALMVALLGLALAALPREDRRQ